MIHSYGETLSCEEEIALQYSKPPKNQQGKHLAMLIVNQNSSRDKGHELWQTKINWHELTRTYFIVNSE